MRRLYGLLSQLCTNLSLSLKQDIRWVMENLEVNLPWAVPRDLLNTSIAIPFGPPGLEKVSLNVDSLWTGGPFDTSVSR